MITKIDSCSASVIYDSDLDVYDYLMKHKDTIEIPNLIVSRDNDSEYFVKYQNSNTKKVVCDDKSISIMAPIDQINEETIIYPATVLLEKQFHDENMATLHSACVVKDNRGILLLGKIGSGKTTTALNLCIDYDYLLMSNDKTLIKYSDNKVFAYAGPKFIFMRYESIKRNLPNLLPTFEGRNIDKNYVGINEHIIDTWLKKIRIQPSEIGINETTKIVPITDVYILHVDEGQNDLVVKSGNNLTNILLINEGLNKTIRAVEMSVKDKEYNAFGYIPSYDDNKYFEFKSNICSTITNDLSAEYVSGNVNIISDYINSKHMLKYKRKEG